MNEMLDAWMDQGPTVAPRRIADATSADIRMTRQRAAHSWWLRRFSAMNMYARVAVAAAAVVVLAIVSIYLLPRTGGVGGDPTPTPSPSPSPQAWAAPIQIGRNDATIRRVRFSFSIPSEGGWVRTAFDGMINKFPPGNWIGFLNILDSVASAPCTTATRAVGPSVADLADALTTIPGTEADEPVDAIIDGRPAKLVTFTINDDIGCDPSSFWLYGPDSAYPNSVDSTIRVWVFELDGTRYAIHTNQEGSDAEHTREITEIVESIQFE